MNEVAKLEHIENEISIIEESHKSAILSINENLTQLVSDCLTIVVGEDKESYEKAVELKRIIKSTHVSIEKKRKELKQPLIDYGKRLDKWVEEIYNPLVNAEKIVKKKMENYENLQEIFKNEIKLTEEKEKNNQSYINSLTGYRIIDSIEIVIDNRNSCIEILYDNGVENIIIEDKQLLDKWSKILEEYINNDISIKIKNVVEGALSSCYNKNLYRTYQMKKILPEDESL